MILLVDNQLPVALARHISAAGWECIHVQDVALDDADDRVIQEYSKERNMVILTKDEDFQILANRQGSIPPQVVWIRIGNCRKVVLLGMFSRILPSLRLMLDEGQSVIEIRQSIDCIPQAGGEVRTPAFRELDYAGVRVTVSILHRACSIANTNFVAPPAYMSAYPLADDFKILPLNQQENIFVNSPTPNIPLTLI